VGEDPLLKRSQLRSGLQPELFVQRLAASAIHIKRIGLAPASVKREHQLPQQPLTVGVAADECLEFPDQTAVVTEREVSVDSALECCQTRLLQARDLALSKRLVREIGERLAAPQPQRSVQQLAGSFSVTVGKCVTPVCDDASKRSAST
jgi:hypothetical protein